MVAIKIAGAYSSKTILLFVDVMVGMIGTWQQT